MSGHSKWSTIKRKKGALDAKRSKIFSKLSKEIMIAVKDGGSADPQANSRLRLVLANARGANMPKDNINRVLSKASSDNSNFMETTFEGYSPGGVAIFIECLSDNNNRTVGNIRSIFNKRNGNLGTNGSLSFLFDRTGVFTIEKAAIDADELQLELIEAGMSDFEDTGDRYVVYTAIEDFGNMQRKLESLKIEVENAELQRIPNTTKKVDVETAKIVLRMIEAFEEDEDVQNVFHNMQMTEEIEKALSEE